MTAITLEIETPDYDYIDVTFFGDCYWEEGSEECDYGIRNYNKRIEIFGDAYWEQQLYSDRENKIIKDYLYENLHIVEHKLRQEYENFEQEF